MVILGIDPGIAIVGYGIIEYKNNKNRKQVEVDTSHAYVRGEEYYGGNKK